LGDMKVQQLIDDLQYLLEIYRICATGRREYRMQRAF
jgi:hypothetical protein